ncbi:MAG: ATP-binding protein [Firmicutes bacterium]|nr:ATP-binding protein [Bacillota bacterium]
MRITNAKKKLPVGIENFAEIRTEDFYYVDKTAMIRDLLNAWGKVNLFTRPRRFGKSLNMSMLKCFFEIGCDKTLFDGLEISKETELCERYMGKFPVVSVSLKGVDGLSYDEARSSLCSIIGNEALRFQFLLDSDKLNEQEKGMYNKLINVDAGKSDFFDMSDDVLTGSLRLLSELLHKHYGENVVLLIDEYDVPLAKANERGYYPQMVNLIRKLFNQALKTNDSLFFAVMTGCLRVAKESIFTGLNNPKILSITSAQFDEQFGFNDIEVREMLEYYGLTDKYESVKEWYDGYLFGNVNVYCPWDVINYCDELLVDPKAEPKNYWSNTSGNDVVRHFIERADSGMLKDEIESLIAGETVVKEIREDLTYNSLYDSIDNVWSVLFTTGYLTSCGRPEGKSFKLKIPNKEIRDIFADQVIELFKENVEKDGETLKAFCYAIITGNAEAVEKLFTSYLRRTISLRDTYTKDIKENYYHGILMGIFVYKSGWYVKSNRETGDGHGDIIIKTEDEDVGAIIEVKYAKPENGGKPNEVMYKKCEEAIRQIDEKHYTDALIDDGCQTIYKYGITCRRKMCRVLCETEEAE